MVLALLFSSAAHVGILLFWKDLPWKDGSAEPALMVVRLLKVSGAREEAPAREEPPEGGKPVEKASEGFDVKGSSPKAGAGACARAEKVRIRPRGLDKAPPGKAFQAVGGGRQAVSAAVRVSSYRGPSSLRAMGGGPFRRPQAVAAAASDLLAEIRRRIEAHKSYPGLARRNGWEGDVVVELRLDGGGELRDVQVVRRSGYRVLDRATLSAVRRAGPFPPLSGTVKVPVSYRLDPD